MIRRWSIAVPVWGKHYVETFLGPVLISHLAAISKLQKEFPVEISYTILTDDPERIMATMARIRPPRTVILVAMPTIEARAAALSKGHAAPYGLMSMLHATAFDMAGQGDRIAPLCADLLVSKETFVAAERRFRAGKRIVISAAPQARIPFWGRIPGPLPARELLQWNMDHAHDIIRSCFWGTGYGRAPWTLYFREKDSIVMRGFHIHPAAAVKDREIKFTGTVDVGLLENYNFEEIHVVTSRDELAMCELSLKKRPVHGDNPWPLDVGQILAWALRAARPHHWWNFRHRIAIVGDANMVSIDGHVAAEVMRLCPHDTVAEAPL